MGFEQPVYGNYRSYYNTKRPSLNDARIALLPSEFFKGKSVLDVGCNEGWVSCEIAQRHGATKVIGVDIDDVLIRSAWKRRRVVWSQQAPLNVPFSAPLTSVVPEPAQKKRKRKREHTPEPVPTPLLNPHYFPLSMQHMFGALPIPAPPPINEIVLGPGEFPHNVTFRTADWVSESPSANGETELDIILALSISKWIHLNKGDDGLISFFQRAFNALKPGGKFVLEPQGWEGYAKAKRMHPRLKQHALGLKLRPDDFEGKLIEVGFSKAERVGMVGEGQLRRPIDVYAKPK